MVRAESAKAEVIKGPWELPEGWEWIKLQTVVKAQTIFAKPSNNSEKFIRYLGLEDVEKGQWEGVKPHLIAANEIKSTCIAFTQSHILYAKLRPYLNKVVVPKDDGVGFTEWIPLQPDPTQIDRSYLAWYLRSPWFVEYASSRPNTSGARMPRIRMDVLWSAPVPIPFCYDPARSLETQRRIVSRIEALLAEVKRAHTLLEHIRRDADIVLDATLAEVMRRLDRRSPESPTLQALVSAGRLTITGGGTPSTGNKHYWNGAIPWVSPKDMKSWYIDDTQDHISPIALEETAVRLVPKGSVLVVVRGMILAHTFPVSVTTKEVTINQDMKALSPTDDFLPEYLAYILRARASSILREVEIAAHGTRRLKTDTLMQVVVPDIPKDSQQRTVAYLDSVQSAVNDMRRILDQDAKLLDQLEQSILQRAFRGEL